MVQCVTAIALYVRRKRHDAVTHADQRVFELASTGVVSAIYCVGIEARLPPFGQTTPTTDSNERTAMDKMMIWLRDAVKRPLVAEQVKSPHGDSFLRNFLLCTTALKIQFVLSN